MAVAAEQFERLRTGGLAEHDPDVAALLGRELDRQREPDRADRLRELHLAGDPRGRRLGADEQVRGGLPRSPLLRRLRDRRRDRAARDRPSEGPVRRRPRERPAACGRAGQHGRLPRPARARRHRALAPARPRRPPDARAEGQLLGAAVHDRPLRGLPRDGCRGRGGGARARARAPAEARALRRVGVPAHGRHGHVPSRRRRGRRAPLVRHGALRRARRRRAPPEPGRALRRRHLDDPQDARRAALGPHPLPGGARPGDRPRHLPGAAGRAARARDRGEGDVLQDRRVGGVPRLPASGPRERRRARGDAARGRHRPPDRRHRHASPAARPPRDRVVGEGRRGAAPCRRADHEPEHRPVRRAPADRRLRRPARLAGRDHPRLRRGGLPRGRADRRRGARRRRGRRRAPRALGGALRPQAVVPGLPGVHDVRAARQRHDRRPASRAARSPRSRIRSCSTSSGCCGT